MGLRPQLVVGSDHWIVDISYLLSTQSGKVGTEQSGIGTCEAIKGRRCELRETAGCKERVAPKWLGISCPTKGTG